MVRGGVVGGNYFEVMGLHPVLGRLLDAHDDGPNAAGAVVLTYRFWNTVLKKDPSVIGKTVRLESLGAPMGTIVGVLEPSVPYPGETEIIANVVTSPHHLSATMVTGRVHQMTELLGGKDKNNAGQGCRRLSGRAFYDGERPSRSVFSECEIRHRDAVVARSDLLHVRARFCWCSVEASALVYHLACRSRI